MGKVRTVVPAPANYRLSIVALYVVGIVVNGQAKAYPHVKLAPNSLRGPKKPAMTYAVMDCVGGVPVAVLVGGDGISVRVFDRRVDGTEIQLMTKFGSSPARFVDTTTGSEWGHRRRRGDRPDGRRAAAVHPVHDGVLVRLAAAPPGHGRPQGMAAAALHLRPGLVADNRPGRSAVTPPHSSSSGCSAIVPALGAQSRAPKAALTPTADPAAVRHGKSANLLLKVVLPEKIHVQSNKPRDPAFFPTARVLTPPAGVTVTSTTYPAAVDFVQEGQAEKLAVFEKTFTVTATVAVAGSVKPGELIVRAASTTRPATTRSATVRSRPTSRGRSRSRRSLLQPPPGKARVAPRDIVTTAACVARRRPHAARARRGARRLHGIAGPLARRGPLLPAARPVQ